jgi:hypothetical protein
MFVVPLTHLLIRPGPLKRVGIVVRPGIQTSA